MYCGFSAVVLQRHEVTGNVLIGFLVQLLIALQLIKQAGLFLQLCQALDADNFFLGELELVFLILERFDRFLRLDMACGPDALVEFLQQ